MDLFRQVANSGFVVPVEGTYTNQTVGGQQVLVPDIASNKAALKKFIFNS